MIRQTRTLILLGMLVLAVALVIWMFVARQQGHPLPSDSVITKEDGVVHDAEDPQAGSRTKDEAPSLCDDLALSNEIGEQPVEERRTKGVAIYEGDPERQRRVDRMVGGDSTYWVWKLPETRDGYWIECRYEGGKVRARRLPDTVSECTVALQRSAETPVIRGVACS